MKGDDYRSAEVEIYYGDKITVSVYGPTDVSRDTTFLRCGPLSLMATRAGARELIRVWTQLLDETEANKADEHVTYREPLGPEHFVVKPPSKAEGET